MPGSPVCRNRPSPPRRSRCILRRSRCPELACACSVPRKAKRVSTISRTRLKLGNSLSQSALSSSGCAVHACLPSPARNSRKLRVTRSVLFSPKIGDRKLHQKFPARLQGRLSLLSSGGSYAVLRQASSDEGSLAHDDLSLSPQN